MFKVIISIIVYTTLSFSKNIEHNLTYIDHTHNMISKTVLEWSHSLDNTLSRWLGNKDTYCKKVQSCDTNPTKEKITVDAFFQKNKYFNETENTFIRLRTDTLLQTKESHKFNLRVSAQIPFSRSKKNFKFFLDDLNVDTTKNVLQNKEEENKVFSEIGLHYFVPKNDGIISRYSLGIKGLSAFVRGRYSMDFHVGHWKIEPVETLKYSSDDGFEEETNIYFDKKFEKSSLFRIQLHRKTQEDMAGMDYAISLKYYWSPIPKTGFRISQAFLGNTKYSYTVDNTIDPVKTDEFSGINNYVTSFSWRQNIWRDWLYYEVTPSVNFHIDHEYKANYAVRIFFDFYFGKYH
ncbi:hypothetical protein C9926_02555 [Sulfurovum lithotrophicum]|nr:hypothetical protein C9926_02555 [Sulfurovum lithotrophicum]